MSDKTGRSPLYVQVRTIVLERIASGTYKPGAALPNEFDIAAELGVSQGTARKALDSLARDGLVVRRQGRGTYVAEQTPADVLFRFFKVYRDDGERVQPTSRNVRVTRAKATVREARVLAIEKSSAVIRIARTRCFEATPIIRETICVPANMFPGLDSGNVPNTLYDLFQHKYGITVSHAHERIEAVRAGDRDARQLEVIPGTPLLKVDRITHGLGELPIEWRVSLCHLKGLHYRVDLR